MLMLIFIASLLNSGLTSFLPSHPGNTSDVALCSNECANTQDDWPMVDNEDITLADDFGTHLSAITQDFQHDFKNIKSIQDKDNTNGSIKRYYSLVLLEDAYESFIEEDTLTGRLVFEARYIGSTLASVAQDVYEILKANIDYVGLSSCTLVEGKETIHGSMRSQLYDAYLVKGQSTPIALDMIVEVAVVQGPVTGSPGNETIVWIPAVRVFGK